MKKYLVLLLVLVGINVLIGPGDILTPDASGQTAITSISEMRPVPGEPAEWTLQKLLHGWLNTKFTVGAKDIFATNTVTVTDITTAPTAGYILATNAIAFFSGGAGSKGMLQSMTLVAHTNAALRVFLFKGHVATSGPWTAMDYDVLNRGHWRLGPALDFTSWTALGTGGASGPSYSSTVYGLNIPVTTLDGNLHMIMVQGDSPIKQAGWNGTGTAPIHIITCGIDDSSP